MVGKWGWARTEMTKWVNACIEWLLDTYGHLLTITPEALTDEEVFGGSRVRRYAEAMGRKMGMPDPTRCRVFGFVDGKFL